MPIKTSVYIDSGYKASTYACYLKTAKPPLKTYILFADILNLIINRTRFCCNLDIVQ